jgi:putative aldouronate transport system permease protein
MVMRGGESMVIKKSIGSRVFDVVNVILLTALSFITLYPFINVVFQSLSDSAMLQMSTGFLFKPVGFSVAAYDMVLKNSDVWVGYGNTIIYVVFGTIINLVMSSLAAFVLSRKDFYWNRILLPMVLVTMFFAGGLIPKFLLVKNLGMYDTFWAMLLPCGINTWNMLIMRTNFASIPDSLVEASKIDGANDVLILFRIIIPLSLPILAVMTLYYGVAHWNSWFDAMVYLSSRSKFPLQLFLREILIANSTTEMLNTADVSTSAAQRVSESVKYATIVVATVPILCVYPFLQKYFVKGVMVGAVKG